MEILDHGETVRIFNGDQVIGEFSPVGKGVWNLLMLKEPYAIGNEKYDHWDLKTYENM